MTPTQKRVERLWYDHPCILKQWIKRLEKEFGLQVVSFGCTSSPHRSYNDGTTKDLKRMIKKIAPNAIVLFDPYGDNEDGNDGDCLNFLIFY